MESKSERRERYRKRSAQRKGRILSIIESDWKSSGELAVQTQEIYPEITPDFFILHLVLLELEGLIEEKRGQVRLTEIGKRAQRKYMSGEE